MGTICFPAILKFACIPGRSCTQSRWRLENDNPPLIPPESSINSHIDNQFTSVKYTSFDQVIHAISTIGRGAFLGKMDIKSAFRLIPIRPQDFHLLGFYFEDNFYIDKCLPFGCSVSCNTFEKFSTFLEWLIRTITETQTIHHYLDDYIFISSTEHTTLGLMSAFHSLCVRLGIPLNGEKTEGPATVIKYLGLTIDTQAQTIFNTTRQNLRASSYYRLYATKTKNNT